MIALSQLQSKMRKCELSIAGVNGIAITGAMVRMWALVYTALQHQESVLLIGETGCGKTTVCQMYAASLLRNQRIRILNCHQSTEVMDIIGGLRPVRGREIIYNQLNIETILLCSNVEIYIRTNLLDDEELRIIREASSNSYEIAKKHISKEEIRLDEDLISKVLLECTFVVSHFVKKYAITSTADPLERSKTAGKSAKRLKVSENKNEDHINNDNGTNELMKQLNSVIDIQTRYKSLFEWVDGPLVQAMKDGDIFLLDEVNLADDAVIERLNSVLESNREITLAEKGTVFVDLVWIITILCIIF